MAASDESSDSQCHLEVFLSLVLVTGGLGGGGMALCGGGGDFSITASSPSQSPRTIPAHVPSSSAPVYPMSPNLAQSPALYLPAPTHTSEHSLPYSQSLNPLKMADFKGGSAARRPWRHIAVAPRHAHRPCVCGVDHYVRHLQ